MKLVAPFETSMERTEVRRILLVQADVDGVTGWGECVAGESPYYSPETTDTAWLILRDFLWPMIKGQEIAAAADIWEMFEQVRGHNMAKAALESAIWDAEANQKGVPLAKLLGGTRDEISEIFLQVMIYAGAPAAVDSFRTAREVFAELDKKG